MTALGIGPDARRRLSAPRIAEIVADELRRQIIDGELADGDLLPRPEVLVEQFNVSLVSLREALRILETEGLLRRRALETQSNSTGQAEIQHPVGAP